MSAEMVGAIANCAVAVVNVFLFVIGFGTLRNDRKRITRMEEGERRRFAENVYAWIEERSADQVVAVCRNGGSSAIYDVSVYCLGTGGTPIGARYKLEFMKPLEERPVTIPAPETGSIAGVALEFRDPAGARWTRELDGRLAELSAPDARLGSAVPTAQSRLPSRQAKAIVAGRRM